MSLFSHFYFYFYIPFLIPLDLQILRTMIIILDIKMTTHTNTPRPSKPLLIRLKIHRTCRNEQISVRIPIIPGRSEAGSIRATRYLGVDGFMIKAIHRVDGGAGFVDALEILSVRDGVLGLGGREDPRESARQDGFHERHVGADDG